MENLTTGFTGLPAKKYHFLGSNLTSSDFKSSVTEQEQGFVIGAGGESESLFTSGNLSPKWGKYRPMSLQRWWNVKAKGGRNAVDWVGDGWLFQRRKRWPPGSGLVNLASRTWQAEDADSDVCPPTTPRSSALTSCRPQPAVDTRPPWRSCSPGPSHPPSCWQGHWTLWGQGRPPRWWSLGTARRSWGKVKAWGERSSEERNISKGFW